MTMAGAESKQNVQDTGLSVENMDNTPKIREGHSNQPTHRWKYWWLVRGQIWAMLLVAIRTILTPLVEGWKIDWASLPKSILLFAIGGVVLGYILKIADNRKRR